MKCVKTVKCEETNGQKRERQRGEITMERKGRRTQTEAEGYTAMMSPHAGTVGLRNTLAI